MADKINLQQLAKIAGMSTSHFVRLFKETAGMSPYQYLIRQRLLRACELLRSKENRITEIAFDVGFKDVSDFNHMFKKFLGCAPRQFRQSTQSNFPV